MAKSLLQIVLLAACLVIVNTAQAAGKLQLRCQISDEKFVKSTGLTTLEVNDMLGAEPESNLPDASLMEKPSFYKGKWIAYYSNECDNSYGLSVPEKAVKDAMSAGSVATTVSIEYFNAELAEEVVDDSYLYADANCIIINL